MEKKSGYSRPFGKRGEHLVLIQLALVILFISLPAWPDLRDTTLFSQLELLRRAALAIGMISGTILGIGGSIGIRRYLTPFPYPVDSNRLVDTGVYALVRHPLYTAQLLVATGWSIHEISLSHLLVAIVATIFFHFKASKEEAWLTEKHPEYREYARKVGKFLPGTGKKKQ
ncbi:MAG: isoprenylcysteine carboxylmethyltransferase family protein [Chlorobiaceae bacterium]|nr:isoprenylcysteine carboxylmethyltransferase family protein [Chlorobiaceae bacterium]